MANERATRCPASDTDHGGLLVTCEAGEGHDDDHEVAGHRWARFRIRKVEPIGTTTGGAFLDFANGTGHYDPAVTSPTYPESPRGEALRMCRLGQRKRTPEEIAALPPARPDALTGLVLAQDRADTGERYFKLGDAARLLGMGSADLSGLETGRLTFVDPTDWERAMRAMRAAR